MEHPSFGIFPPSAAGNESIIADNLFDNARSASADFEKRLAFLSDGAAELAGKLSEKAEGDLFLHCADEGVRALYVSLRDALLERVPETAPVNERPTSLARAFYLLSDTCCLCRKIAETAGKQYSVKNAVSVLFGDCPDKPPKDKKIAFVRNLQSGRAFECFARYVFGAMTAYYDSFALVCEAVASGECGYGILPLRGSVDGRLGTFYRMLDKYELGVLLCTDVENPGGDRMRYALIGAGHGYTEAKGTVKYECCITMEDPADIGLLTLAARAFSVTVDHMDSVPSGRTDEGGTFCLRFSFGEAEQASPFLFFLQMEFPQILPVAFYTQIEGIGETL